MSLQFAAESQLVRQAVRSLPFRRLLGLPQKAHYYQATEVKGLFGVPDLVAAAIPCGFSTNTLARTIAFEMKLADWRRGLIQAFRYRTFARSAFLVLDNCRVQPALASAERFRRSNVGLIGLELGGKFTVYVEPVDADPFSPELATRLVRLVEKELASARDDAAIGPKITKTQHRGSAQQGSVSLKRRSNKLIGMSGTKLSRAKLCEVIEASYS